VVAAGVAVAVVLLHAPGNVSHPSVEFTRPNAPTGQPTLNNFEWPRYGFDAARTHLFPGAKRLDPPLRTGWTFEDYALLEFPPVIYKNTLYIVDDNGSAKALNKLNGRKLWENKVGTLSAASPALAIRQGLVIVPILSTKPGASESQSPGNGRVVALSMRNGRVVWSHPIASGTESSPLTYADSVYFGDQDGTVYKLRAGDGHQFWTYHASGAVKGGPAYANGNIYFGDYAGRAYALSARTGRPVWTANTSGAQFGFGSGNFYSTPAVAFGRVYMGNTDGRVYSFASHTGNLAWATGTGAYVYASAAVANIPGVGPTVYIGSYDGTFYAFDARSGSIRWTHRAGGRISGSGTIVGDVVYFSDLGSKTTTGLDVRTGRQVFFFPDGAFNPVVSDFGAIYLSGYSRLYQMLPKRRRRPPAVARRAPAGRPAV
jgi:outer membrane protein assembly factor BamB